MATRVRFHSPPSGTIETLVHENSTSRVYPRHPGRDDLLPSGGECRRRDRQGEDRLRLRTWTACRGEERPRRDDSPPLRLAGRAELREILRRRRDVLRGDSGGERGSQTAGLEYTAWDMAVGKGGRVHVAMGTNAWKLKLPQEEWGYFYASLDPGSSAFSPVRNINKKPSEGFSLAADEKGNVTACWLSDKLYANVSHDNGETFAPSVELDRHYNPCNCCTTSAAYGEDGRLAVLYREETNNERDMYLVLWDQDRDRCRGSGSAARRGRSTRCPMTYYSISRGRGGFVAAWPTKGQIYFARMDGEGDPLPPAEIETPGRSGMRTGMLALTRPRWKHARGLEEGRPARMAALRRRWPARGGPRLRRGPGQRCRRSGR